MQTSISPVACQTTGQMGYSMDSKVMVALFHCPRLTRPFERKYGRYTTTSATTIQVLDIAGQRVFSMDPTVMRALFPLSRVKHVMLRLFCTKSKSPRVAEGPLVMETTSGPCSCAGQIAPVKLRRSNSLTARQSNAWSNPRLLGPGKPPVMV